MDRGSRSTLVTLDRRSTLVTLDRPSTFGSRIATSDGLNEVDHTYGGTWKKCSEDTWRVTLTYPKIQIGDIIGFGTFWLVNTIINRVQFASNITGRLLFRAEFLAPDA